MEDKFELVDDFQSPKHSKSTIDAPFEDEHNVDWRPLYYDSSEHPLRIMVCNCSNVLTYTSSSQALLSLKCNYQVDFDRESLLSHPLVKELIDYKWKRIAIPGFLIYLGVYMIFLILLTSFALTLPIPGQ